MAVVVVRFLRVLVDAGLVKRFVLRCAKLGIS